MKNVIPRENLSRALIIARALVQKAASFPISEIHNVNEKKRSRIARVQLLPCSFTLIRL